MAFKAFDLVPVITNISHDVANGSLKICTVEAGGADLFLGTTSGLVLHYQYQVDKHDRTAPPSSVLLTYKSIVTAPVEALCLASALERLLVVVDDTLLTLHAGSLTPVDGYNRYRGVTCLTVNPNPRTADPFFIQVCVGRRRQLLVLNVTAECLQTVRELAVPERPQALAMNGDAVCAAAGGQYLVYQVSTGRQQPLFQYDPAVVRPLVTSIHQDEFLVLGPADLAMFALVTGTSERPPVQLRPGVQAWTYQHPYIITSDATSITLASVEDQQLRQTLAVPETALLGNFDGTLLVCAGATVLALCPVPWQAQVKALLGSGDLDAAVALLNSSPVSEAADVPLRRRLGLAMLARNRSQPAAELLLQARADPRELICLVPGLLVAGSTQRPSDLLADVPKLAHVPEYQLRQFLTEYVPRARSQIGAHREMDTALVLLLADQPAALAKFILEQRPLCDTAHCHGPLTAAGRAAELGQLLLLHGQERHGLALWADVVQSRQPGDTGAALRYMAEALTKTEDTALLHQFADCVLETDPQQGARIFVERPSALRPLLGRDEACAFLKRYPAALILFLENMVVTKGEQSESLATQLAGLYLDRVAQCRQLGSDESAPTQQLLRLLRSPAPLRVSVLLHRTLALALDRHSAHLYSRTGEFEKALELVVAAEGGGAGEALSLALELAPEPDTPLRRRLFHGLLDIHLRRQDDVSAAVDLLNSWGGELDAARALAALPAHWSVAVVGPFLLAAVRRHLRRSHTATMQRALATAELRRWRRLLTEHQRRRVTLPANTYCPVCHQPLTSAFALYPNGTIVHPDCATDPRRCPVTGQLYGL